MALKPLSSTQVVLASSAPWRSQVLTQLGIQHRAVQHRAVEPKFKEGFLGDFVRDLAVAKAKSLELDYPNGLIIAADQLLTFKGEVMGKPGSQEEAILQLTKLNGLDHRLFNGVAVLYRGKVLADFEEVTLWMRELSQEEIKNYIKKDQPLGSCGSYRIEALGASLFEKVQGSDPYSVLGLPANLVLNFVRELGFSNLL